MGKLILVRHGQTQMNADKIYFGKLNPPLNETGRKQALEVREKLKKVCEKETYDFIHASPLERTKETAEIVNYLGKEILLDSRLEELNFGIFEGLRFQEICEKYPEEYQKSVEEWQTYNYETGENLQELQKRAWDYISHLDFSKNHLVVSHWGVICSFLSYVMSKNLESYWKFKVVNGGIVVLEIRDDFPVLEKFL